MIATQGVHHGRLFPIGFLSVCMMLAIQLLCGSTASGFQQTPEKPADSATISPEATTVSAEPDWVTKPGLNELVVETPFRTVTEDLNPLLQNAVTEAVAGHLSKHSAVDLASLPEWSKLPTIQLSEAEVKACLVQTFERKETVSTIEGPRTMVRTTALISIPESIEKRLLNDARIVIGNARSKQVAVATISLWGMIAVLTITFRLLILAGRPFRGRRDTAVAAG